MTEVIKQNCADGQVPDATYQAVHYKSATDEEFKAEMERRGYRAIRNIKRIDKSCNCNEARRAVFTAWKDCRCSHVEYANVYDATLGESCAIWQFDGEYGGEPQQLPSEGKPIPGFYGRDV